MSPYSLLTSLIEKRKHEAHSRFQYSFEIDDRRVKSNDTEITEKPLLPVFPIKILITD